MFIPLPTDRLPSPPQPPHDPPSTAGATASSGGLPSPLALRSESSLPSSNASIARSPLPVLHPCISSPSHLLAAAASSSSPSTVASLRRHPQGLIFREPTPTPSHTRTSGSMGKRIKSVLCWMVTTAVVCALVLGILYGLVGKVDFTVRHLSSSTNPFPSSWGFNSGQQCIGSGVHQCSTYSASPSSEKTWTMRATFPEYVVALATIVGSVLFAIFGGVGIACLPLGLIFSFIRHPKVVITRSQYIKEATELSKKARELKKAAEALHQEERSGSKGVVSIRRRRKAS